MAPTRIFITGASSGIGAALAKGYAAPGVWLGLVARREDRLAQTGRECRALGANVLVLQADTGDRQPMERAAGAFLDWAGGIDLVIANAGLSGLDGLYQGDPSRELEIITTNTLGLVQTLAPFVPVMKRQRAGQLVAMGSLAGFVAMPGKGGYCASKAAVKTLMDSYRPMLRPYGIQVTTLCPGWIETELTQKNTHPMPFQMSLARAEKKMRRAIAQGRATYSFPWVMAWLVIPLARRLPDRWLPRLKMDD